MAKLKFQLILIILLASSFVTTASAQFLPVPFLKQSGFKLVQSVAGGSPTAYAQPNIAGDLLVAFVYNYYPVDQLNPISISDTAGNTWIAAPPSNTGDSQSGLQIFFAPNA